MERMFKKNEIEYFDRKIEKGTHPSVSESVIVSISGIQKSEFLLLLSLRKRKKTQKLSRIKSSTKCARKKTDKLELERVHNCNKVERFEVYRPEWVSSFLQFFIHVRLCWSPFQLFTF